MKVKILIPKATEENTGSLKTKHPTIPYKALGKTSLSVSGVGFGGYRLDLGMSAHEKALLTALRSGINLIDTSSNYTNGNSERLIGNVINTLISREEISREEIVIVTKGGYLQGVAYDISQERKQEGRPYPDLVEYDTGLEHCVHPLFLEAQITQSLFRLSLDSIDVYLLHNPEYYLSWAHKQNIPLKTAREEYYRRIKLAFEHLEQEVEQGRIQYYGVSSNTFPVSQDAEDFTSLEKLLDIANEITPDHHFSVIELPMNLFELGAAISQNQSGKRTVLDLAKEAELGVLLNRPLNAFSQEQLIRLADPQTTYTATRDDVEDCIESLFQEEDTLTKVFEDLTSKEGTMLKEALFSADVLDQNLDSLKGLAGWNTALNNYFLPRVYYAVERVKTMDSLSESAKNMINSYVFDLQSAFYTITGYVQAEHAKLSQTIKDVLDDTIQEVAEDTPLSTRAINVLRQHEAVTSVLIGMRQPEYVKNILDGIKEPVSLEAPDWEALERELQALIQ